MTDQTTYTPPPLYTQEDIDALVSFIQDRIKPLRAARYGSEDGKALQGLLDICVYIKGVAQAVLERGQNPSVEFHALWQVAGKWTDHPDFQPAWDPYG